MNTGLSFHDFHNSLSYQVGEWLLSQGYLPANSLGRELDEPVESDHCGILLADPAAKPKTSFFGLISHTPRKIFLGVIWFDNSPRDANLSNWVFEFFGRPNTELVTEIANELIKKFRVNILLKLVDDMDRFESIASDSDWK